jgi:uncharacterized BrkB/YihY/UPF0761 family membrane protein
MVFQSLLHRYRSMSTQRKLKLIGYIPCVFILAIIGWSYTAHILQLFPNELVHSDVKGLWVLALIAVHAVLGLFLWCYYKCVFVDPGSPLVRVL